MVDEIRTTLRERIAHGATLEEIDTIVRMSRGLRPDEREELWRWAWSYEPEPEPPPLLH
jgi:hypothetical protein